MKQAIGHGRPNWDYKQPVNICPRCDGKGYTRKTAPVIRDKITLALGSGCPSCKGTGRNDG